MIYREAGVKKLDLGAVAYPAIGILGVVLLALIPPDFLHRTEVSGPRPCSFSWLGDSSLRWGWSCPESACLRCSICWESMKPL